MKQDICPDAGHISFSWSFSNKMAGRKRGHQDKALLESFAKVAKLEAETEDETFDTEVEGSKIKKAAKDDDPKVQHFREIYNAATDADIIWEYETFQRLMPQNLLATQKQKILSDVKHNLNIFEVLKRRDNKGSYSRHDLSTPVLDALAAMLGYSLRLISPPVKTCIYCGKELSAYTGPVQVQLHTRGGTFIASKYSLRCRKCTQSSIHSDNHLGKHNDIQYHPTRFGNKIDGYKEYTENSNVNIVRATEAAYVEEIFAKQYFSELHHGWLSSQAKAEAFNETNRGSYQEQQTRKFLELNPDIGKRFQHGEDSKDDDEYGFSDDDDNNEEYEQEIKKKSKMYEINRKTLSQAMLNHQIKSELSERGQLENTRFGPMLMNGKKISFKESRYEAMKDINEQRKSELYPHQKCYKGCEKRGCSKISTIDGLWKLHHATCLWDCSTAYPEEITKYVPQACPEQPDHGSAFCSVHGKAAVDLGR